MTLRNHYTQVQQQAAAILDAVRAGLDIDDDEINWALLTLGETLC